MPVRLIYYIVILQTATFIQQIHSSDPAGSNEDHHLSVDKSQLNLLPSLLETRSAINNQSDMKKEDLKGITTEAHKNVDRLKVNRSTDMKTLPTIQEKHERNEGITTPGFHSKHDIEAGKSPMIMDNQRMEAGETTQERREIEAGKTTPRTNHKHVGKAEEGTHHNHFGKTEQGKAQNSTKTSQVNGPKEDHKGHSHGPGAGLLSISQMTPAHLALVTIFLGSLVLCLVAAVVSMMDCRKCCCGRSGSHDIEANDSHDVTMTSLCSSERRSSLQLMNEFGPPSYDRVMENDELIVGLEQQQKQKKQVEESITMQCAQQRQLLQLHTSDQQLQQNHQQICVQLHCQQVSPSEREDQQQLWYQRDQSRGMQSLQVECQVHEQLPQQKEELNQAEISQFRQQVPSHDDNEIDSEFYHNIVNSSQSSALATICDQVLQVNPKSTAKGSLFQICQSASEMHNYVALNCSASSLMRDYVNLNTDISCISRSSDMVPLLEDTSAVGSFVDDSHLITRNIENVQNLENSVNYSESTVTRFAVSNITSSNINDDKLVKAGCTVQKLDVPNEISAGNEHIRQTCDMDKKFRDSFSCKTPPESNFCQRPTNSIISDEERDHFEGRSSVKEFTPISASVEIARLTKLEASKINHQPLAASGSSGACAENNNKPHYTGITPPPDYCELIQEWSRRGIRINTKCLVTPPPAYLDEPHSPSDGADDPASW